MESQINGRQFEWDELKAMMNVAKHGVYFEDAARVFDDEFKIIQLDEKHSVNEARFQVIGMVDDVLFVVCTERIEKIRLISARRATNFERSLYYGNGD